MHDLVRTPWVGCWNGVAVLLLTAVAINGEPITNDTAKGEGLIQDIVFASKQTRDKVQDSVETLRRMEEKGLAVLFAHLYDTRRASEFLSYEVVPYATVGYVCRRLIRSQIEYAQGKAVECEFVEDAAIELWWKERVSWSLVEMQIEAAACSAVVAKNKGNIEVEETAKNRLKALGVSNITEVIEPYSKRLRLLQSGVATNEPGQSLYVLWRLTMEVGEAERVVGANRPRWILRSTDRSAKKSP